MRFKGGEMILGRKGPGVALAVLLLLVLASVLAAPAWAQTTDDNPIDGSTVNFTRDAGEITEGIIDVSEFESCKVEEGATITVRDDDGTEAVFEDLEAGVNATNANAEIDYDGDEDEIVINPLTGEPTITPDETEPGTNPGL